MAKAFYISTKGMAQIMEANGLSLEIKDFHAIVRKSDQEIFNETVKRADLTINEESQVYKDWPKEMINKAVFRYLFHRLQMAGYIPIMLPDNVDVYEIEFIPSDNAIIKSVDSWKILDFSHADVTVSFLTSLMHFSADYIDHSGAPGITEHIYSASITDTIDDAKKHFNERDFQLLLAIQKECADQEAFYFRIIQ